MNWDELFNRSVAFFRLLALPIVAITACVAAWLSLVGYRIAMEIPVSAVLPEIGLAYQIDLRSLRRGPFVSSGDAISTPAASTAILWEDGNPLGPAHSLHLEVRDLGGGRFSHWGESLIFSASDSSDPRANNRKYVLEVPLYLPIYYPLLPTAFLTIMLIPKRRKLVKAVPAKWRVVMNNGFVVRSSYRNYFFWGGILLLWGYFNLVFYMLLPGPVPAPDTLGYLIWSLYRTVGYPALLDTYRFFFQSWESLPLFQLNLLLLGLFSLSYAISRLSGSYTIGWLFLALVTSAGNMLLSAADMLAEASFSTFFMMHLGFFFIFLNGGRSHVGLLCGLALAATILINSVAVVLLVPSILFAIFLPDLRRKMFIMIFPAVIAWLAPSAYNYARNGVFESSIAAGYALAGHVAWGIRSYPGSVFAEEARLIERRLTPVLMKRPANFPNVAAYIDYTTNEYNTLLWGNIVPELRNYYSGVCSQENPLKDLIRCSWRECESQCLLQLNSTLLQLTKETVFRNSAQYAYHVLAHFYGLWRDVFAFHADFLNGANKRAEWLPTAYSSVSNNFTQKLLGSPPTFKEGSQRAITVSRIESSAGKKFIDFLVLRKVFDGYVTDIVYRSVPLGLVVGLFASILVVRLRRISCAGRALCYTSLCVNAYFLGHALAQPVLLRYAWRMQGAVAAVLFLGIYLAIKTSIALILANNKWNTVKVI